MTQRPRDEEPVLGPLGIDPAEERIYRTLLLEPGLDVNALGGRTGLTRKSLSLLLAALQEKGLVVQTGAAKSGFFAVAPGIVVESIAAKRRQEIEQARLASLVLQQEAEAAVRGKGIEELVTVVEGADTMRQHCRQLVTTAASELIGFETPPYSAPAQEHSGTRPALERGVSCRFIYEPSALEIPGHLDLLLQEVEAGEDARVFPKLPVWMLIADRQTALVPLDIDKQAAGGAVLIHTSWLLDALITLFDSLWDRAVPVGAFRKGPDAANGDSALSETDRRILTLMSAGLKDAAISTQLSMDPSTVRRRVSRLMGTLDARSRFQAGLQASRRGWL